MLTVTRLSPLFGAEVTGADLHQSPNAEFVGEINELMAEFAVIVLRDQDISDEEQLRFSRALGPLELPPHMGLKGPPPRRISRGMYDVSNLDDEGNILPPTSTRYASNRANAEFHTDSSFNALPTKWSILSARIVPPEGADTIYADTRAAYDALPVEMKEKAASAVAEHYFWKTRSRAGFGEINDDMKEAMPPVRHNIVRTIPESGRAALYIGSHATHIVDWSLGDGEQFLDELNEFATQERFTYRHKWRHGDLVLWDNRCTLHRGTPYDDARHKRDLRRTTINEHGPEISSTDAIGVPRPH
jgi:alpha-ketoglutarate-dependent 2,4-dichlorophenoxyacetate dioxygenase